MLEQYLEEDQRYRHKEQQELTPRPRGSVTICCLSDNVELCCGHGCIVLGSLARFGVLVARCGFCRLTLGLLGGLGGVIPSGCTGLGVSGSHTIGAIDGLHSREIQPEISSPAQG